MYTQKVMYKGSKDKKNREVFCIEVGQKVIGLGNLGAKKLNKVGRRECTHIRIIYICIDPNFSLGIPAGSLLY